MKLIVCSSFGVMAELRLSAWSAFDRTFIKCIEAIQLMLAGCDASKASGQDDDSQT